ncbi:MAG: methionyl-tRNA formyltransferase [Candidatus Nanopelagicales bacterium]
MRLLFAGTPEVAVRSLQALVDSSHEVCAVLTRPDAAAGRGRRVSRSPVARRADELGIPVLTPASPRDPDFLSSLRALEPDCGPIVAYGAILPSEALGVPAYGWVNLHFSLLPAWRGAAPVQHAILHGDAITGATTFLLEEGLDTGPVFDRVEEPISAHDTSGDLLDRLAHAGATLLVRTMDAIAAGGISPVPQSSQGASYAPKIDVERARIAWDGPAESVDRLVRACTPAPGAWTTFRGERVKLGPVRIADAGGLAPGEIAAAKSEVTVGTGTASVRLGEVRPEGRRPMPAADWARGLRPASGEGFA